MFVHADTTHLFFNMFALYMFGENMEVSLQYTYGLVPGSIHFIILYFAGGFAATIWPFIRNHDNVSYSSVGASGAVSAIIFAMILWYPEMELFLLFIPIPIPGYIFGALYLAFEYYMSRSKTSRIAHDAHFGGAIFGIIYILIINIDKGKELLDLIF
jgi:membrane associated rhomboid family serine protease